MLTKLILRHVYVGRQFTAEFSFVSFKQIIWCYMHVKMCVHACKHVMHMEVRVHSHVVYMCVCVCRHVEQQYVHIDMRYTHMRCVVNICIYVHIFNEEHRQTDLNMHTNRQT